MVCDVTCRARARVQVHARLHGLPSEQQATEGVGAEGVREEDVAEHAPGAGEEVESEDHDDGGEGSSRDRGS